MIDICAVGNALVDVIISVNDEFLIENNIVKGTMQLIDEDVSDVLLSKIGGNNHSAFKGEVAKMSSGGSAANTVAGAANLGSKCCFFGKIGNDVLGKVFANDLKNQKISFSTQPSHVLSTGRCLSFVTPDAQRSMVTFLGAASEFDSNDLNPGLIEQSKVIYLEGYLFDKPSAQKAFVAAAKIAHKAGRKVAMTLSDAFCVDRHREAFLALIQKDIDIIFGNKAELTSLYQTDNFEEAIRMAHKSVDIVVATQSEEGAVIMDKHEMIHSPAHAVPAVVDTTGAGDLFAAGFLHGLTSGKTLRECGHIANIIAAECISHYGPRPPTNLREILNAEL
ncbi:MAG: adenosine kinase [Alphaproteobacteria bacterium]|nr:adenosine kinase [Alphaproteobacteria bacterium]